VRHVDLCESAANRRQPVSLTSPAAYIDPHHPSFPPISHSRVRGEHHRQPHAPSPAAPGTNRLAAWRSTRHAHARCRPRQRRLHAAKQIGADGQVIAIDIAPKMGARLNQEKAIRVFGCVADVYQLPFDDQSFDLVTLITVIGEIPSPEHAIRELERILSSQGRLVFSELLFDPDYPRAQRLAQLAQGEGFRLSRKVGNFFYYTLIFEKNQA